jgi:DNA-binding transcriptional regulator YhcF (GntR family)
MINLYKLPQTETTIEDTNYDAEVTVEFIYEDSGERVSVIKRSDSVLVEDLIEHFTQFLEAMGFSESRVMELMGEYVDDYKSLKGE